MPFDGTPPRKQTLTPQKVLRDLSQLLREPERWPEGFRWHYGTINICAIGLCREALGERAYRKLASYIDYPVDRTHCPETRKIIFGLPLRATPENVAEAIDAYLATGKLPEVIPPERGISAAAWRSIIAAAVEECRKQRQTRIRKAKRREADRSPTPSVHWW